ncbi:MAG: class I SAM-dependent methyltransferase [Pseudohongiellaceae bacterium]|nr:class I SAM-dependent methyltransferase [Pseudohongiellaceae bacterium]
MSRRDTVMQFLDSDGLGLEIGPSHNPVAPKREGFRVEIIDHLSQEELLEKYRDHKLRLDRIESVDYVWNGETYSELTGKTKHYDWVIASHLIEHTPDLIEFLNGCAEVLKDDGVLSLVIPDKRYCFDHFRPLSSLGQVIDAHVQKRVQHTSGTLTDYFLNVVHLNEQGAWDSGSQGQYSFVHSIDQARSFITQDSKQESYTDVHAWCFVPHSFRLLIDDLNNLGLIQIKEIGFTNTKENEFYISLGREGTGSGLSRLELQQRIELELKEQLQGKSSHPLRRVARKLLRALGR